jgi:hypothetical protein
MHRSGCARSFRIPGWHGCHDVGLAVGASVLSQHVKNVSPSCAGQHTSSGPKLPVALHRGCIRQLFSPVGARVGTTDGAGVSQKYSKRLHFPNVSRFVELLMHRPLRQSRSSRQRLSGLHGGQCGPPQSAAVSRPFRTSLRHDAGLGFCVGDAVDGTPVGASVLSQQL